MYFKMERKITFQQGGDGLEKITQFPPDIPLLIILYKFCIQSDVADVKAYFTIYVNAIQVDIIFPQGNICLLLKVVGKVEIFSKSIR